MKKFITTAFVMIVAVYAYSQTYLPLTGGTLTGELVLSAPEERKIIGYFRGPSDYNAGLPIITHRYQWYSEFWDVNIYRGGGADVAGFSIGRNGNNHLAISSAGNISLSGALAGTSAIFGDYISAKGHSAFINNSNGASWNESALEVQGSNNPGIGFHWPSQYGASLYMNSSGVLNWSGAGLSVPKISSTGHSAFINNGNGASWSESVLEVQGSNNPGIGFHWPSQYGASLYMNSTGILNWSGTGLSVPKISSTGHSAFVNNSNGANWSESALEVQGSNNPAIAFHWPGQYAASLYMDAGGNLKWGGNGINANGPISAGTASFTGSVGIVASNLDPEAKLTVGGKISSREVKVAIDAGADFVFQKHYHLKPLTEVAEYISENKHLPEIASADEMKKNGLDLGEFNIKLLQKVEELTLHLIEQDKKLKKQEQLIELLMKKHK